MIFLEYGSTVHADKFYSPASFLILCTFYSFEWKFGETTWGLANRGRPINIRFCFQRTWKVQNKRLAEEELSTGWKSGKSGERDVEKGINSIILMKMHTLIKLWM